MQPFSARSVGTIGIESFATDSSCHFLQLFGLFCYQVPLSNVKAISCIIILHSITSKRLQAILW